MLPSVEPQYKHSKDELCPLHYLPSAAVCPYHVPCDLYAICVAGMHSGICAGVICHLEGRTKLLMACEFDQVYSTKVLKQEVAAIHQQASSMPKSKIRD